MTVSSNDWSGETRVVVLCLGAEAPDSVTVAVTLTGGQDSQAATPKGSLAVTGVTGATTSVLFTSVPEVLTNLSLGEASGDFALAKTLA